MNNILNNLGPQQRQMIRALAQAVDAVGLEETGDLVGARALLDKTTGEVIAIPLNSPLATVRDMFWSLPDRYVVLYTLEEINLCIEKYAQGLNAQQEIISNRLAQEQNARDAQAAMFTKFIGTYGESPYTNIEEAKLAPFKQTIETLSSPEYPLIPSSGSATAPPLSIQEMFASAPPEQQQDILNSLQAALQAATTTVTTPVVQEPAKGRTPPKSKIGSDTPPPPNVVVGEAVDNEPRREPDLVIQPPV